MHATTPQSPLVGKHHLFVLISIYLCSFEQNYQIRSSAGRSDTISHRLIFFCFAFVLDPHLGSPSSERGVFCARPVWSVAIFPGSSVIISGRPPLNPPTASPHHSSSFLQPASCASGKAKLQHIGCILIPHERSIKTLNPPLITTVEQ